MFNYYLFNESYENATTDLLESNLQLLNSLFANRRPNELFLKHETLWSVNLASGTFGEVIFSCLQDKQFSSIVVPRMLEQIRSINPEIANLDDFNHRYRIYNAFFGIFFSPEVFESCIFDQNSYSKFFERNFWTLTPETFWERRAELFSRVVLCSSVENQLKEIGGTYLAQVVKKIRELDRYVLERWTTGNFSYNDARKNSSLEITPESKSTMQKKSLVDLRTFSLPDGRRECFELHIKTGNLRFHFYPENLIIYIGYIGKHLPTS